MSLCRQLVHSAEIGAVNMTPAKFETRLCVLRYRSAIGGQRSEVLPVHWTRWRSYEVLERADLARRDLPSAVSIGHGALGHQLTVLRRSASAMAAIKRCRCARRPANGSTAPRSVA